MLINWIMIRGRRHHPAPWLFGITVLPYGVYYGFISTAMPYLLRNAGVAVDRIAGISALSLAPPSGISFGLRSPTSCLRRRSWLILTAALSAALPARRDAFELPLNSVFSFLWWLPVPRFSTIVAAANGGLMAADPGRHTRGHASGCVSGRIHGGGALGAGVTLWLFLTSRQSH